jgi:hypothetical protein
LDPDFFLQNMIDRPMNLVDSPGWLEFLADGPRVPLAAAGIILAAGRLCQATGWPRRRILKNLMALNIFERENKK